MTLSYYTIGLIAVLILMLINIVIMSIKIARRNSYVHELEDLLEQRIKLQNSQYSKMKHKLDYAKEKIQSQKVKIKKGKMASESKIKITKVKSKLTNKKKKTNKINDFENLDAKISKFEKGLENLKKGKK